MKSFYFALHEKLGYTLPRQNRSAFGIIVKIYIISNALFCYEFAVVSFLYCILKGTDNSRQLIS